MIILNVSGYKRCKNKICELDARLIYVFDNETGNTLFDILFCLVIRDVYRDEKNKKIIKLTYSYDLTNLFKYINCHI